MVTYGKSSTSTILNGLDYAWTIATTTTGNSPIIAINTSGGLATTSIIGGFSVQNGAIEHDFSTGLTSIDNLALGATTFDTDVRPVEKSCSMAPFWTENPPMMEVVGRPPLVFIAMMGVFSVVVEAIVQA